MSCTNIRDEKKSAFKIPMRHWNTWYIELGIAILVSFFFFVLTDEGCAKILGWLHFSPNDTTMQGVIRKVPLFMALVLVVVEGVLRYLNDQYIRETERKDRLIVELREVARRFTTVHDNLHLIFQRHLESIGRALNFGRNDRISLYVLKDNMFVQIARHSTNPEYAKRGRMIYPIDQGVIAETRAGNDIVYEPDMPSYKTDQQNYIRVIHDKYKIEKEVIRNLTMHPRFMAGLRIASEDGSEWNAVLILESLKKNAWAKGQLKEVLERNRACIYKLICDFPDSVSALPDATKEGL